MFENMSKRRLMELAGIDLGKLQDAKRIEDKTDSDAGLHGEHPIGGDATEEHLDKETDVFQQAHDALDKLLNFLHSQEDFEEKRGKEPEYAKMEQDAEDLKQTMKKHLAGYEGNEDEPESNPESEMKPKMSFR